METVSLFRILTALKSNECPHLLGMIKPSSYREREHSFHQFISSKKNNLVPYSTTARSPSIDSSFIS